MALRHSLKHIFKKQKDYLKHFQFWESNYRLAKSFEVVRLIQFLFVFLFVLKETKGIKM